MARRRRSTRRRRRAPLRRLTARPVPSAPTAAGADTPAAPAPRAAAPPRFVRLPALPHLRTDLAISAGLGLVLALAVLMAGRAAG